MSFTLQKKTLNLQTFIGHLLNMAPSFTNIYTLLFQYILEKHPFTRLLQTGQSIQVVKKNLPINILSKINVGSRSYPVWSWEIWVRYQANGEAILFQSQMTVNLKLNLILSTDTMVMELIKGKWGFLTNSEMLLPEDNIFFVCYSRSDEAVLAKKWCCWRLECRNLLPNFYFFSNFFYHHGNHVHLLICRLEVQVASRTLRGK